LQTWSAIRAVAWLTHSGCKASPSREAVSRDDGALAGPQPAFPCSSLGVRAIGYL